MAFARVMPSVAHPSPLAQVEQRWSPCDSRSGPPPRRRTGGGRPRGARVRGRRGSRRRCTLAVRGSRCRLGLAPIIRMLFKMNPSRIQARRKDSSAAPPTIPVAPALDTRRGTGPPDPAATDCTPSRADCRSRERRSTSAKLARHEGVEEGRREERVAARREVLRMLLRARGWALDAAQEARIDACEASEALDAWIAHGGRLGGGRGVRSWRRGAGRSRDDRAVTWVVRPNKLSQLGRRDAVAVIANGEHGARGTLAAIPRDEGVLIERRGGRRRGAVTAPCTRGTR